MGWGGVERGQGVAGGQNRAMTGTVTGGGYKTFFPWGWRCAEAPLHLRDGQVVGMIILQPVLDAEGHHGVHVITQAMSLCR